MRSIARPGSGCGEVFTNSSHTRRAGLAAGRWSHLAVTFSEGSLRLYFDRSLVNSSAVPGVMADPSGPLRIGGEAIWAEFIGGLLDELRAHNRALTAAEIRTDINTPSPPEADASPVASGPISRPAH